MEYTTDFTTNQNNITPKTFIQQIYNGTNDWWRYAISLIITLIGWQFIGVLPLVLIAFSYSSDTTEFMLSAKNNFIDLDIDRSLYLLCLLFTFIDGLFALLFSIKYIHGRSVRSIITSRAKIDWNRFLFAFLIWFTISLLMIIVDYTNHPNDFIWNFDPIKFLILLIISFTLIPFQTSFEEILMRGYLMQGLGGLVKNRWIPLITTSIIFGLLHGLNPEVAKLGNQLFIYYIATGLLFGVITLLDEGLELSMGLHAANNIAASLLVTTDWTVFQTDALWVDTSKPEISLLMYVPVFILYPILILILYKKYKWKDWKNKLFGKI